MPLEQLGVTIFCDEQLAPHPPQSVMLVDTLVSQPATLVQSARPVMHTQVPLEHCMPLTVAQSVPWLIQPEPSALQVATRVPSQPTALGVQTRVRHVPVASSQYWLDVHGVSAVADRPFAEHCLGSPLSQKRVFGWQSRLWHWPL